MFTSPLFQINLVYYSVDFKARELWKLLSRAVSGKFHGSGGHRKSNNLQNSVNFHRTIMVILICIKSRVSLQMYIRPTIWTVGCKTNTIVPHPSHLIINSRVQYMHTLCILLCFIVVWYWSFVAISFTIATLSLGQSSSRPISLVLECACSISHNISFRTEMWAFLFWMEYCRIWNRRILGFVNLTSCHSVVDSTMRYIGKSIMQIYYELISCAQGKTVANSSPLHLTLRPMVL